MNTTTKTIEQLRADAAAAAEALAAAQAAAAEAERVAAAEAARLKEIERRESLRNAPVPQSMLFHQQHYTGVAEALKKLIATGPAEIKKHTTVVVTEPVRKVEETPDGPDVRFVASQLQVAFCGSQLYMPIDFLAEQEGGSSRFNYRSRGNGRVRMTVGNYGERKSFPPRKDGTYAYDAMALVYFAALNDRLQAALKERAKNKNADALEAIKAEYALPPHTDIVRSEKATNASGQYRTYVAPVGQLFLKMSYTATPEQVRAMLDAAIACGLMTKPANATE